MVPSKMQLQAKYMASAHGLNSTTTAIDACDTFAVAAAACCLHDWRYVYAFACQSVSVRL